MTMVDIELVSVSKDYGESRIVRDVDLSIPRGEFVSILGPSGCGKTTTLNMIAGFLDPTSGVIRIRGQDQTGVPPERRSFRCFFADRATRRSGDAYALRPDDGRYTLIYRPFASMVDCGEIHEATLFGNYDVNLRVRAVLRLRTGRSVVRSGVASPLREDADEWTPRETLRYRLKVARVR